MVLKSGHLVNGFLDWLVERRVLVCNPIAELHRKHRARSTTAVLRAMAMPRPQEALQSLQPLARYGSHLGAVIREHVERMQTLGIRAASTFLRRVDLERPFICVSQWP